VKLYFRAFRTWERSAKRQVAAKKARRTKRHSSIKDLLLSVLEDSRNRQEWEYWLKHKDPHYRWEALKLAQFYMFGKPVQPVASEELAPPIKIDISAIPKFRVKAKTEDEQS
jgi:hypothetical protein